MNNPNSILSKVYELHRIEIDRLKENHKLELNAKLGQINKQAETIRKAERIYTRCPACGNDTLTNNEGHLLCTWHVCPNPTAIENLSKQLLSALAAIEKHTCTLGEQIDVDLSLLHEHDAEVRKPLVDLLLEIRELMPDATMKDLKDRIDALAKVKDKP